MAVLGARGWFRTARVPVSARVGCFGTLQKMSTNPYFISTSFLPFFSSHFSQLVLRGRAGDARLDFERPGVRVSGGLISDIARASASVCVAHGLVSSSRCPGMFWEG